MFLFFFEPGPWETRGGDGVLSWRVFVCFVCRRCSYGVCILPGHCVGAEREGVRRGHRLPFAKGRQHVQRPRKRHLLQGNISRV